MAGMHFLDSFFSAQKLGHCSDGCLALGSVGLGRGGFVVVPKQGLSRDTHPVCQSEQADELCKPTPVGRGVWVAGTGKVTGLGITPATGGLTQPSDLVSSTVADRVSMSLQTTDGRPPWTLTSTDAH